jgi:phosphatidylglycerophosphate synthase
MLDATIQTLIARPLDSAGRKLARTSLTANAITLLGAVLAVPLIFAIASGSHAVALTLLGLNRLLDGLDGAVARSKPRSAAASNLGGYLDIVADYVFYAGVPFGFALAATDNAVAAAALLASFLLTCSSFLAYAALAAKQGVEAGHEPRRELRKSFFYSRGLMEGTETIAFFVVMILWPSHFAVFAWIFAALCVVTALQRAAIAVRQFR